MLFDGQAVCTEPVADFFTRNIFYRPQTDGFLYCWYNQQSPAGSAAQETYVVQGGEDSQIAPDAPITHTSPATQTIQNSQDKKDSAL